MSDEERDRLKAKELRKNPGGTLNNAWAQAHSGAPSSGCLINIISVLLIVGIMLVARACSN